MPERRGLLWKLKPEGMEVKKWTEGVLEVGKRLMDTHDFLCAKQSDEWKLRYIIT